MASLNGPVIILEDDMDEKALLIEVIEKIRISNQLKFFSDGEALIDYLEKTTDKPFLIISDINIPRMNGLETKEVINGNAFLRHKSIPFVYLSTSGTKAAVEKAYDLNAQGFFVKQNSLNRIERQLRLIFEYWQECVHTD